MMSRFPLLLALGLAALGLQGCVARTVASVVTAPVRVVSKGVDLATTSQSEADEARGREIRRREARMGELEREYGKAMDRCDDGDDDACESAKAIRAEMKVLARGIPVDPEDD
ncbi:hypothetical protein [Porphyrobacter sp. AAP82]|uniref:hypothetical protein n=1 Tax=Porphyrobacter sp. AAP82 TaxID=1248917 RepID=UPI00030A23BD|nr:hypothetical protein [Porphyrobacter sp. AAP82]